MGLGSGGARGQAAGEERGERAEGEAPGRLRPGHRRHGAIIGPRAAGNQRQAAVISTVSRDAALIVTAAGLIVAAVALVRTRRAPLALALLLDFLTAAALLHLAAPPTWPAIGAAALTIAIRQLASHALTAAGTARHR